METNQDNSNFTRRKFLKGGIAVGAAVGLTGITGNKKSTEQVVQAIGKKEHDEIPLEIDPNFKRYDVRNQIFRRIPELMPQWDGPLPGLFGVLDDSTPGNTQLDHAICHGAGAINSDKFEQYTYEKTDYCAENKYNFKSKEEAAKAVKKAAKFFGASLVGITPYDKRWIFDPISVDREGNITETDSDLPFEPKSVIVMAHEIDYKAMATAPSMLEMAGTMLEYSHMAEISYKVAVFVQQLGYKTFAAGNNFGLSPAYGVAAGLGEIGRNGILVTQKYGPRVRISKVFTEMELEYDKPITIGITEFCKVCMRCADQCPSSSISHDKEPSMKTYTISNLPGIKKWYINSETCFKYWMICGNDCGTCITSCPYSKPDFWHHKLTSAMTGTPVRPFLKYMDELFGYGNTFDEKAAIDFWEKD